MSAEATGWVIRHSPFKRAAFTVHLVVADSVNDQHENLFWMSIGKTAVKARVERRTAGRGVAELCEEGFLELVEERPGGTNLYRFLYPEVEVIYDSRVRHGVAGDQRPGVAGGGSPCRTPPGSGVAAPGSPCRTNPREPKQEPKQNPTTPPNPPEGGNQAMLIAGSHLAGCTPRPRFGAGDLEPPIRRLLEAGVTEDVILRCLGRVRKRTAIGYDRALTKLLAEPRPPRLDDAETRRRVDADRRGTAKERDAVCVALAKTREQLRPTGTEGDSP